MKPSTSGLIIEQMYENVNVSINVSIRGGRRGFAASALFCGVQGRQPPRVLGGGCESGRQASGERETIRERVCPQGGLDRELA
jgi:hypothetical protein